MPMLPALISRPAGDVVPAPLPGTASGPERSVREDLAAGVPARVGLDATRALLLAVPLGTARAVLDADPLAVVYDSAAPQGATQLRDAAAAWPRLTLLLGGAAGDTVPVVPAVPVRLAVGATAAVEVTVDRLVLTAGSLRSPGRFGSRLELRWRLIGPAPDAGPPAAVGDPSIPPRPGGA